MHGMKVAWHKLGVYHPIRIHIEPNHMHAFGPNACMIPRRINKKLRHRWDCACKYLSGLERITNLADRTSVRRVFGTLGTIVGSWSYIEKM